MRKVKRPEIPRSLVVNAAQWTEDLMNEIDKMGSYSKVDSEFKEKYRQNDVKDALEKMYTCHCCYCESIIGLSTYGRIEHLKPKSLTEFHKYSFDWNNLHWCCEICNTSYKKTNWDFVNPILDPAIDEINQYLKLNLQNGEYEAINNNPRALTTINHTGLNRDRLTKARHKLIIRIIKDYKVYKKCGDANKFLIDLTLLKEDCDYPGLYDELITYLAAL